MEPISESRKHALLIAASILVARPIAQIKAKGISLSSPAGNSGRLQCRLRSDLDSRTNPREDRRDASELRQSCDGRVGGAGSGPSPWKESSPIPLSFRRCALSKAVRAIIEGG